MDRDTKGFTRRSLLRSGLGAAIVGAAGRGEAASASSTDAGRAGAPSGTEQPADGLSVRAAAEWTDRKRTPSRVRGNGPPFADRPDVTLEEKVTFDGKETTFFPEEFASASYDMGMAYRTSRNGAVDPPNKEGLVKKGLIESHRFNEDGADWRSLRNTLKRHEEGVRVRCLWANTTLIVGAGENVNVVNPYKHHDSRAEELGQLVGSSGYDVAAFCEVFKQEHADKIVDNYEGTGRTTLTTTHDQSARLLTIVGHDGSGTIQGAPNVHKHTYDSKAGQPFDFKRGYNRHVINVTGLGEGLDFFSTHLQTNGNENRWQAKVDQLKELTADVADRQQSHGHLPKVVVGDLNVKSSQDYNNVSDSDIDGLTNFFGNIGLHDAWTTHGGPLGDTFGDDIPHDDPSTGPYPGGTGTAPSTCYCKEFPEGLDTFKQNRLDYVFVEEPRSSHDVRVDVSRMWRVPFASTCQSVADGIPYENDADRLIDHAGIGFELLITPR